MLSVVHRYTLGPDPDSDNTYRNKIVDSKSRQMAVSNVAGGNDSIGQNVDPFKTKLQR